MQGYFFIAATTVYVAIKWRYVFRIALPKVADEVDDLLTLRRTDLAAPALSVLIAFVSAGIVLLRDEGFFLPASDVTKLAYVTLAVAAISVWIPDDVGHSLTVNVATLCLAAHNVHGSLRGWWWTVFVLQSVLYVGNLVRSWLKK